jgi:hypothetical protein
MLTGENRSQTVERRSPVNAAIAGLLVVLTVSFLPWWRADNPLTRASPSLTSDAPVGVTAALGRMLRPGERIFNAETWGSWFELNLPRNPTFVDSRIEVFPSAIWRQYVQVSFGQEGWQQVLDRWDVAAVAADRGEQQDLIPRIMRDPGWRLAYEDEKGFVFVRSQAGSALAGPPPPRAG